MEVGFRALIQFNDVHTASAAKNTLNGKSIPRYLLPKRVGACNLSISYSGLTDLNIRFQSHRSWDYTKPSLPVNLTVFGGFVPPDVGSDETKRAPECNVLFNTIEHMHYVMTSDVLHTVIPCSSIAPPPQSHPLPEVHDVVPSSAISTQWPHHNLSSSATYYLGLYKNAGAYGYDIHIEFYGAPCTNYMSSNGLSILFDEYGRLLSLSLSLVKTHYSHVNTGNTCEQLKGAYSMRLCIAENVVYIPPWPPPSYTNSFNFGLEDKSNLKGVGM